ncbi:hypothetical protein NDU88_005433 [Pleurodeles waltl]|uniref:Uncharacterized protein n=1 Tax=Pleurodeles waltl TaxID=8319 RepID=A0AAV7WYN2_PLEWA|nr:hypothetical protein NDU88_005433 [Pleurodeles waltl]
MGRSPVCRGLAARHLLVSLKILDMAGTGHLRSGAGAKQSQDTATQDRPKRDAVLAAVERIGDSLERARTSLETKIDKVDSDLVLLHVDQRNLADKTGTIEARIDELAPTISRLGTKMGDTLACIGELERRAEDAEGRTRRNNIRLRIITENKSHFFATPEAAWKWLESMGRIKGRDVEGNPPAPRSGHTRMRRGRRVGGATAENAKHAPDMEQIIQERREALQSAAAVSASPSASEAEAEISHPPSDRPTTPDQLSGSSSPVRLGVTPGTADDLF